MPKFAAELKGLGYVKWKSCGLIRYRDLQFVRETGPGGYGLSCLGCERACFRFSQCARNLAAPRQDEVSRKRHCVEGPAKRDRAALVAVVTLVRWLSRAPQQRRANTMAARSWADACPRARAYGGDTRTSCAPAVGAVREVLEGEDGGAWGEDERIARAARRPLASEPFTAPICFLPSLTH